MKDIIYSKQALKFLDKITLAEANRIRGKIEQYVENPSTLKNQVKKLVGSPFYRLRVGSYRVIFDDKGMVLFIVKIDHRGSVYKEF